MGALEQLAWECICESSQAPGKQKQAASVCKKLGLNGLVLIGATHTMSDGCALSEYFLANEIDTSVVVVPATVNGNIRNSYISTSIGFDTASKVYS